MSRVGTCPCGGGLVETRRVRAKVVVGYTRRCVACGRREQFPLRGQQP
jgi:hypothetical protein